MTESECLVFTMDNVILVCLIDKRRKKISYPQGVGNIGSTFGSDVHSLNMLMNGEPFLIVATPYPYFDK